MSTTYQMVIRASRKLGFAALFVGFASWAAAHNVNKQDVAMKRVDQAWLLNSPSADPTQASNYTLFTGNLDDLCSQEENTVCGIMAPGTTQPQIDEVDGLRTALENGTNHANIKFGPFTN